MAPLSVFSVYNNDNLDLKLVNIDKNYFAVYLGTYKEPFTYVFRVNTPFKRPEDVPVSNFIPSAFSSPSGDFSHSVLGFSLGVKDRLSREDEFRVVKSLMYQNNP